MEKQKANTESILPSQVLLYVTFLYWGTNAVNHRNEPAAMKQTHNFDVAKCSISLININSASHFVTGKNLPCQRTAVKLANNWLQTERSLAQLLVEGSLLTHLVNLLFYTPPGFWFKDWLSALTASSVIGFNLSDANSCHIHLWDMPKGCRDQILRFPVSFQD